MLVCDWCPSETRCNLKVLCISMLCSSQHKCDGEEKDIIVEQVNYKELNDRYVS
jgi:hypothetical protein